MRKNILFVLMILNLCACLKIQKKGNDEALPTVENQNPVMVEQITPVVFTLNTVWSLTDHAEIIADEVRLSSLARIYTNQFKLSIHAKKLIVEQGALIQTFDENHARAWVETAAVDGGTIDIKIAEAEGYLQVFMNGQQGGEGKSGWILSIMGTTTMCQPNSGWNSGRSGSFFLEADQATHFFITTQMQVAEPGPIGVLENVFVRGPELLKDPSHNKYPRFENCQNNPVPGKPGSAGQICMRLKADESPQCEKF